MLTNLTKLCDTVRKSWSIQMRHLIQSSPKLLVSTRSMQASMELMRQQIQESKQEITTLQYRLERATEEALTDPLTGLVNRKGLSRAIESALLSASELNSYPCMLMLDIDHFKKINDTFGHPLGDRVIKVVADTLRNQIKGKDIASRYGGEEFCIFTAGYGIK